MKYNKEVECAVLGALLIDSNALYTSMNKLFIDLFYIEQNQIVFNAIQRIYDRNGKVDILTVMENIMKNGDRLESPAYLTTLTRNVVSAVHIESHILILAELYLKRECAKATSEGLALSGKEDTDAFDLANKILSNIEQAQEKIVGKNQKEIAYYIMRMLEEHASVKETGVLGIQTDLETFDKMMCGLVEPDLIILAARPSQGKTALALTITKNTTIDKDIPCGWFSLEMDGVQLVRRLTSMVTGIPHSKIRNGHTTNEEDARIHLAASEINKKKLFIEDNPSMNIRDIKTRAHVLKKKHDIKYIVVDYLQLMEGVDVKNKSREQQVSEMSRGLKVLAKELHIPVIALSQLSRGVESRADKLPQLSDLRESGGIEQDADEVVFIMRPETYDMPSAEVGGVEYSSQGLAIVIFAKNRHGELGNRVMKFQGELMTFKNYTDERSNYTPAEYF